MGPAVGLHLNAYDTAESSPVRRSTSPRTMPLFRPERPRPRAPGATLPVARLSELAHAWWGDRLAPGWRPHTREENQAILDRVGLTGAFWRLP